MLKILISIFIIFGFSFTLWSLIGLFRFAFESFSSIRNKRKNGNGKSIVKNSPDLTDGHEPQVSEVAIVMAAHNEELVITESLEALKKIIPAENIFVGSDGSTDRTAELVRYHGANVYEINPNRGKAGALLATLNHFQINDKFKYVVFVDADTRLRCDYLKNALPLFNDSKIVAVAGYARSIWKNNIYIAYRYRVWLTVQLFFRFGMCWKHTNVNMIVPGFASMYRTSVLSKINIDRPGLVIEDFNMTFELQKKRLGKIAHHPSITGYTQDPDSFKEYCGQIKRWNLGFWQTIKTHGIWSSIFWLNLIVYLTEVILANIVILVLPIFIIYLLLALLFNQFGLITEDKLNFAYLIFDWLVVLFILDYIYTLFSAVVGKRPELLLYGPTMIFFRWIDAFYLFSAMILAGGKGSTGEWKPPVRWKEAKSESTI
jgi:poly-beta-1,6-N-acetyl-D-glucosamine synthase